MLKSWLSLQSKRAAEGGKNHDEDERRPDGQRDGTQAKLLTNLAILAEQFAQRETMELGRPVDAAGEPIPWFTYPAIEYLKRFDLSGARVFEYGCGQSTLFWSKRCAEVWSVDHSQKWHSDVSQRVGRNVHLLLRTQSNDYSGAINEAGGKFDIVVVDGVFRHSCAVEAIDKLSPRGFLILDNSDWYWELAATLRSRSFVEASFSGFGPVNDYTWTTSMLIPQGCTWDWQLQPPDPVGGNPAGGLRDEWW